MFHALKPSMFATSVLLCAQSAVAQDVLVWSTGNTSGNTAAMATWLMASGQFT